MGLFDRTVSVSSLNKSFSSGGSKATSTPQQSNTQNNSWDIWGSRSSQSPTQSNSWSNAWDTSNNLPGYRDVLGRLTEMYEQDQNQGMMYASQFETLMHDKTSPYYRTYAQPTNTAVSRLKDYGIDTSALNDDFYAQNESWILDNLNYTGTGESPTKPGKKASTEQHIAYWMYQYYKDEGQTKKAEEEYQQALEEARYWGWRSDRNLSDEEIIGKVRENFSAKYPTLAKMENKDAMAPFSLNRAVDFSDDALIGAAWMGRNGEFDGTLEQAMAYSALGRGAQYERNDEISAKLDPNSDQYDGGYSLGSTNLDDAAFHFRVSGFNKQWLDDHKDIPLTGSEEDKKMYAKVVDAYNNQTQGQEELDKLIEFVETKAQFCSSPEDVLKKINWSDYKILAAMDKSIGQNGNYATGDLVPLTEGLAYTYNGLTDYVNQLFEYKSQKRTCDMFIGQITSAIDNTIPALVQQTAEQEAAQQEEAAKIASHSTYRPTAEITETAKAIAAEKDRKTAESAEMTFGVDNDEEKAVNQNQRSAFYDQTVATLSDMKAGGYVDYTVRALAPTLKTSTIKQYSKSVLTGFDTVQAYEQNEKRIEELQATKDELGAKLGNMIHAGKEYGNEETVPVTINGKTYDLKLTWNNRDQYNEETGEMDITGEYGVSGVFEHGTQDAAQGDFTNEQYQEAVQAALDEANAGRSAWEETRGTELTDEMRADIDAYWRASEDLDAAKLKQQDNEEDYQTAKKNLEDAKALQANRIALFKQAGLDTRAMEESAVVTDFFLDFTKYDPTNWGSYNFYHPLSEMLGNGDASAEEAFQIANTGDEEILQAMDVARTMLEYADENGIELPDSVRENVLRYIDSLETQHQDFEYMSMMRNEDFAEGAAEGRKRAEELAEIDYASFDAGLTTGQTYREVLESQPSWDILTEDQRIQLLTMADQMDSAKESALISGNFLPATYGMEEIQETYNAYLKELKIEDRAFGAFPFQVPMGEIMTDYELDTYYYLLGTQGFEAAQEYSDHIALDGGVLNSRLREEYTEKNARELADKGVWGSRAADVLSMLLSPIAAAQSFAYSVRYGLQKLTGERMEWDPNSADLSANIYKKAAREEIQNQIAERYKDNPVLQKFFSGLQEIISNRGDSIVNGLVFGPLFQGVGNEMLQEFASAMPMAVAAATDAVSEAKEKGASDTQLLGIYATNLLFEAGTEAVSLDNIKNALKIGEDLTADGLKEWAVNWLTKAGVSEMIGETVTEYAEQLADTINLGENSDYARAVEQYKADGMSEDEAKQQASLDQVKNLLHTALISYLSPGADIGSYAVGRYSGYRSEARAQQLAGNNVSVMDVYNNYKQQKQGERAAQNGTQAEIAEIEANNTAPDIEGPYVGEVETNRLATIEAQQAQQIAEAEEQKRAAEAKLRAEGLTLDIEILETAATGDPSVQTASIAAVLNTDRTDESFDVSNAAAVHMNALFAGEISPAQSVQNLMLGANVSDVDVTSLKHALETAALSPNSESYKVMQSEEYQDADPAERAEMLAATVEADANNATVQSDISKAVHDNRVARAENDVMDAPEVKGAYEKAYNAQGKLLEAQEATQQAQEQLDGYESELDAKRDALRTAGDELSNDASDATRVDMVNHAIADLQKTSEVVEEYRQHLTKTQQKQQEAEEIASRTLQEYQNTKRTLAERLVNEQDQQRSEAQAQAEAQAVIDEAQAQALAEQEAAEAQAQEEEDNAVLLDAEAFIEQQEAANGPLTEEEKQKVRDMFVARNAVKEEQGAGSTAQNAEQAAQQEGQQTTPTVRPNLDKVRSRIANKFGMNIEFRDTMEDGKTLPNGQKFRKNGYYDKATNTIILDSKNATVNDMMYFVLGHELTHVAEQSGKYNDLANSIMRIFYGDNADYQGVLDQLNSGNINSQIARDVAAKKAIYDRQLGGVHSNEEILQEVVADRMGQILYGENEEQRADYINRLCKEDISTARRIVESIKNFLKQVVGMKGAWVSDMQKTVDLFETALKDAQSGKTATETVQNAPQTETTTTPVQGNPSVPHYEITQSGWYGNQPTVRFDSAPSTAVASALQAIGMVQSKDATTFKAQKGVSVPHAKITWALKNVPLPDAGGKTVAENTQNTNVRYSLPEDNEYMAAVERGDTEKAQQMVDQAAKEKGLTIFDDEYPTIQSLYKGVEDGELLIHARRIDPAEVKNMQWLEPTWAETMQGTEAAGWYEEEGLEPPNLIFASEGTTWSGDERNGIVFVKKEGFQQSNGDGTVNLPDGTTVPYELSPFADYDDRVKREEPFGIESGDWYTDQDTEVVAVMPFYAKSADAVTYDDNGNVIPLSERFNPQTEDKRYSLSDTSYLEAVDNGDMETAQKMVDEAANNAGYTTPKLYHGTRNFGFTEFDVGGSGSMLFTTTDRRVAESYSGETPRTKISDRITEDVNNLDSVELLDTAKKLIRKYGDYNLATPEMREMAISDAKDIFQECIDEISGYIESHKNVLSEMEMNMSNEVVNNLEAIKNAKTPEEVAQARDKFDSNLWRMKWENEDMLFEMLNDEVSKKIYLAQNKLRDFLTDEDIYIEDYYGNDRVLRPQLALEVNAENSKGVYELYGNPGKQLVIDANGANWNQIEPPEELNLYGLQRTRDIGEAAKAQGYDSVLIRNVRDMGGETPYSGSSDVYLFFDANQLKSADAVTYDNNGKPISLSKRFNPEQTDIRYSLPSDDILDQQIAEFMNRRNTQQTQAQPSNPRNPGMGVRQWGNEGAQRSDILDERTKEAVKDNPYVKDTNAAELDRAIKWIHSNRRFEGDDGFWASLDKVTDKKFDYRSKDGQARIIAMMAMADAKGEEGVQAQVQLGLAYNAEGTDLAQAFQARKIMRMMTPQGRVGTILKMLDNLKAETGNENLTLSDWIVQAAAQAKEEGEFARVKKAAAAELGSQVDGNWKNKLRGFRMVSMLGNPRTHFRNFFGNLLFAPTVALKNKLGAVMEVSRQGIENYAAKAKGREATQFDRTKTLKVVLPKEIREFAKQDAKFMKDELTGEAKYNEGTLVQREIKPFKGLMQDVIDFNGGWLEKEDWFSLRRHYQRALGGWIDANGYTIDQLKNNPALLDQGREYAKNEAQKATYRDYNGFADKLNQLSRNPKTTGQKALGFAVDAVLPFKKTPANILKRGVEYSPVGLLRGLKNLALDVKNGKVTANQAIDRICSGLSGMAVMAMGAFLSHSGIVTCTIDDDDDKNEKEQGSQKYSIKLTLFGHDITYTLDWAAPISMEFFVGAAIEQAFSKEGNFDINKLIDGMSNIAEPVFNLSMLDGVNSLFKTSQNDDTDALTQIGAKVLSNYASSYVPSVLGAITRTFFDDKRRATYVKSGEGKGVTGTFRYAQEQVENKIPGLSKTNIPVRDVFGREETDAFAERLFENFISPGYISHYKNDPILNEMDRLYNANVTNSEDMVPSDPPKSFTYNNTKYTLSAEEWDTFKTVRGQTAFDMLTELINSDVYKSADDASQIQMIKKVWEYATKVGKNAAVPEYPVQGSTTVPEIIRDGKITHSYDSMLTSLENGDYMGFETMVEALHQMDVEDSKIKEKIANKYRDAYKEAYIANDQYKMAEIEQTLEMVEDTTDITFDLEAWEEQAEKKYNK